MIPTTGVIVNLGHRMLGHLAVTTVEGKQAKPRHAAAEDTATLSMPPAAGNFPQYDGIRMSALQRAT